MKDRGVTVRYDLSAADKEGAIRERLIALGWLPPHAEPQDEAQDAARYRWLRDHAPLGVGDMASVREDHAPGEIDAAIDAAMAQPIG